MKDDYYDLGSFSRPVTTASSDAQAWFDRGLLWAYGFNLEESVRCFERAAEVDPECAMAYWGVAYAGGPYYNRQWADYDEADLRETVERVHELSREALARAEGASEVERALIEALARRYPQPTPAANLDAWNDDYAAAMREVYALFPDDLDVCTLFADALMNRTPWRLWDLRRAAPAEGADTLEVEAVLTEGLARPGGLRHPGVLHFYIHLMEMSPHPEKALRAGDALYSLSPDSGHLHHMPTHIDFLCGHYQNVVARNSSAIVADRKFFEREGPLNRYSYSRIHNYHFKLYGAMFLGQFEAAMGAVYGLAETVPESVLRMEDPPMADLLEGYFGMKMHALIRFGRWREIIAEPLPGDPDLYRVTTAVVHYAKSVACAATSDLAAAERERDLFAAALARVPPTRTLFNNTCLDILAIAARMFEGEIEYRKGRFESAFSHLRAAVELEDGLPYDEPWGWMQPARHALGALLLERGEVEAAEAVYREDLGFDEHVIRARRHPDNVWSLHGFHECLRRQGKHAEAAMVEPRLVLALARADTRIESSCYCRLEHAR